MIFILEGIATVIIALPLYSWLPDSHATAKFLSEEERRFLKLRLENEHGPEHSAVDDDDKISLHQVLGALRDWRIYIAMVRNFYLGRSPEKGVLEN